jgi:hypothetical protein
VYRTREVECPCCHGRAYRVRRRLVDRIVSLIVPCRRYRCIAMGCGWEGNLPPRSRLPARRIEPGNSATLDSSVDSPG